MEWFHNNSVNPYASPETKMILSKKTKLSTDQVSKWLHEKRYKSKKIKKTPTNQLKKKSKRISKLNKKILQDFFTKTNCSPNHNDYISIQKMNGLSEKRIKSWFLAKMRSIVIIYLLFIL
jgi:hypothetical protein